MSDLGLAILFKLALKILCIAMATEIIFKVDWGKIRRLHNEVAAKLNRTVIDETFPNTSSIAAGELYSSVHQLSP